MERDVFEVDREFDQRVTQVEPAATYFRHWGAKPGDVGHKCEMPYSWFWDLYTQRR